MSSPIFKQDSIEEYENDEKYKEGRFIISSDEKSLSTKKEESSLK